MWRDYFSVTSVDEALDILTERRERARIIAGGTDIILEIERGVRQGIDTLVDVSRIPDLDRVCLDEDEIIHLGPLVTHSHCVASKIIIEKALPLAQASMGVGAPQIRNRGTVAGNLITASPANDTITPLMALGAKVSLMSKSGNRVIPLEGFFTGVRETVMRSDEMMVDIMFPAMRHNRYGIFIKSGLRRAQAISLVNVAITLTFEIEETKSRSDWKIRRACITLGAVTPTIIRATEAEEQLIGRYLDEETIEKAAELAQKVARPIDDVRSSLDYRREMVRICTLRGLRSISMGEERGAFPDRPVLLWGSDYTGEVPELSVNVHHKEGSSILTRINGKNYTFKTGHNKSLLRLLREDAGLIGTKEGCAEGECGACTVYLDGMAVMSCLVPAVRAHEAEINTIEGLARNGNLHPVQHAFIQTGAVQCGYCTPGFIMSAVKLLEESPRPAHSEIQQAITGNLCRCTGYYKIVEAIECASRMEVENG